MNFDEVNPMGLVCYDAATGVELWTNELGWRRRRFGFRGSPSPMVRSTSAGPTGGSTGVDEETGGDALGERQIDTTYLVWALVITPRLRRSGLRPLDFGRRAARLQP